MNLFRGVWASPLVPSRTWRNSEGTEFEIRTQKARLECFFDLRNTQNGIRAILTGWVRTIANF